jgi:hypothetical protein
MPNLLSICQFLATSLTFVALQNIELWVDDWQILSLKKKAAPSLEVPIARDVETKDEGGFDESKQHGTGKCANGCYFHERCRLEAINPSYTKAR